MLPGLSNHSSMDVKPETIELFQRDGFVAVSAFYDAEELASIEGREGPGLGVCRKPDGAGVRGL